MADTLAGGPYGFNFRVIGAHRVANRLRKAAADLPDTTDRVVGAWAKKVRAQLKATPYPPKLPGQKYIRTGRLASSWKARRLRKGTWTIQNHAAAKGRIYAGWVVYRGTQNRQYHEGRWWTGQDIIEGEVGQLTKDLAQELSRLP